MMLFHTDDRCLNRIYFEPPCFDVNVMLESYGQTTLMAGIKVFLKGVDVPTTNDPGRR